MESDYNEVTLNVLGGSAEKNDDSSTSQVLPEAERRQCPYCCETISLHARKCWRCHEYFSQPREDLDDRVFQLARREVLQDVVIDIKKWITRIGFGSAVGILLVALLGTMNIQDVLERMVSDSVTVTMEPVLTETKDKLDESEEVLDNVEDSIRLAQHRIAQFDRLDDKLMNTELAVDKVENARQSLESRAGKLGEQFEQLENRFINAKREMRNDRERRLEEMLGHFANRVVTFDKLYDIYSDGNTPETRQLLAKVDAMRRRQISLISPFTLSSEHPTVVFSPSVRLEWQFEGYDLGQVSYRVHFDKQPDFRSDQAGEGTTRLAKFELPPDFPRGSVFWPVEAIDRDGRVLANSDVGYFEFYENSIDRIRSTGAVRVGVACSSEGEFAYFDKQHGRLTGFDIELTRWLAPHMYPQVRPVFIGYNWNQLLDSVHRNEVDFIISTITITPHREEEFGLKFSRPYYKTFQAFVTLRDSGIRSPAHLEGRRLAVQEGTTSETVAEAFTEPANLRRVNSAEVAFEELLRRNVDAVVTDFDLAQSEVRRLGVPAAVIAIKENDYPPNYSGVRSEDYGIAVAKPETELLRQLNMAIEMAEQQDVLKSLKQKFITGTSLPVARRSFPIRSLVDPMPNNNQFGPVRLR